MLICAILLGNFWPAVHERERKRETEMARSTPVIEKNTLVVRGGEREIVVGSTAWFEWLGRESSTLFAFHHPHGGYTARRERSGSGRGGQYWKAYRKHQGQLYHVYMGKAEDLTLVRLGEVAQALAERIADQAGVSANRTEGEARSETLGNHSERETMGHSREKKSGHEVMTPLLETRLRPPRLPARLVERAGLLDLLDGGRQQKLALLHAPAGFGKTTLVSRWLARLQERAPLFVAWLSLEDGDNDPLRFWSALITSCQLADERVGQAALAQLAQGARIPFAQSPLHTALALLLNDLGRSVRDGVVVLEDYHLIAHPQIHETLAFFIEHLPASLNVLLLTRALPPLPLVRWRARGELLEIQASQLRFSLDETALFLQQLLPQAPGEEPLNALYTRLEGWPAGLRLLALSLHNQADPRSIESALQQLSAHPAAERAHRPIQEFFLSEVLAAQPEPLQLFLLQTSLLSRLSGSLCDALTGRQDGTDFLATVAGSGFFLEPLDSAGEWYRYHALFAEAMRAEAARRLGADAMRELSAQASRWYADHAMLADAIEAALFARDFERAGQLIEQLNEHAYFNEHHTMRRWLEQLPRDLLVAHPLLCFLLAQARIFTEKQPSGVWRLEVAEDLLHLAEAGWREQGDTLQLSVLSAFRATFTLIHGLVTPAVAYARQALQFLPATNDADRVYQQRPAEWIEWHCGCLLTLGMEAIQTGAFASARQHLRAAYTLSLRVHDRVFTRVIGRLLGDVCLETGELRQADSYYQQVLAEPAWPNEVGEEIFRAQLAIGLIRLAYERNQLDQAEQLVSEATRQRLQGAFPVSEETGRTQLELLRLTLLRARGNEAEAWNALDALIVRLQAAVHTRQLVPDVLFWQARAQIQDRTLQAAADTLTVLARSELTPLQEQSVRLLTARLHLARGEEALALPLLEQLQALAQAGQHTLRALEIHLLVALAHANLHHVAESQRQLTLVLAQTHHSGLLRLLIDEGQPLADLLRQLLPTLTDKPLRAYAQAILHTFAHPCSPSASSVNSPLLEPLSAQEQRVLTLLAAGRTNPQIASDLVISLNTVKGHLKNLYRKLDATNRVTALETARRLKVI
jgi:LuxR family transcriptional regulator, maltose regulon positive regulatory protein